MAENLANDLAFELDTTIDDNDTSFDVVDATGAPPVPFRIRIDDEFLRVTNVSSLTFTVERAVEDASRFPAAAHTAGAAIHQVMTMTGLECAPVQATRRRVTISSHGFSVGNLLYHTGSAWALADNDAAATAEVIGIVEAVLDSNTVSLLTDGYIDTLSGLTAGTTYFLGDSGALTATEPTTPGEISKPVLVAVSTTAGYFINMRGVQVESSSGGTAGKHEITILASAMMPRVTNGPSAGQVETSTNKINYATLDFDTTTQEFAQFALVLPKQWNEGTITARFVWTAASGSGGVVWQLKAGAFSNDDALDTALGTAQQVADTLITAADVHVTADTPSITIAGTPAHQDYLVLEIARVPSDGSDTLGVDARLLAVVLSITTDAETDA